MQQKQKAVKGADRVIRAFIEPTTLCWLFEEKFKLFFQTLTFDDYTFKAKALKRKTSLIKKF